MVDRLIEENRTLRKENAEIKTKCVSLEEKNAKLTKCVQSAVKAIRQIVPLLALLNENVAKTNAENALTNKILNVLDLGPQLQNAFKKSREKKPDDVTSRKRGAQCGHKKQESDWFQMEL